MSVCVCVCVCGGGSFLDFSFIIIISPKCLFSPYICFYYGIFFSCTVY